MQTVERLTIDIIRLELMRGDADTTMREALNPDMLGSILLLSKAHDLSHIVASFLERNGLLPDGELDFFIGSASNPDGKPSQDEYQQWLASRKVSKYPRKPGNDVLPGHGLYFSSHGERDSLHQSGAGSCLRCLP